MQDILYRDVVLHSTLPVHLSKLYDLWESQKFPGLFRRDKIHGGQFFYCVSQRVMKKWIRKNYNRALYTRKDYETSRLYFDEDGDEYDELVTHGDP